MGTLFIASCSDYLLETPKAELGIYTLNDEGQLVEPEEIVAGETNIYFSNEKPAFFSVVYSGEKVLLKTEDRDGETYSIFSINRDFNDINNPYYEDKAGRRAVKGSSLSYVASFNKYIYGPYVYGIPGSYDVYLQATNTDEYGNEERVESFRSITVIEKD